MVAGFARMWSGDADCFLSIVLDTGPFDERSSIFQVAVDGFDGGGYTILLMQV